MGSAGGNSLTLVVGGMCAGKSGWLLDKGAAAAAVGKLAIYVKLREDTRDACDGSVASPTASPVRQLTTHGARAREAVVVDNAKDLHVQLDLHGGELVLMDEGQFWGGSLVHWVRTMLSCLPPVNDVAICVSALSGDSSRAPWPVVSALLPLATSIVHLTALCTECHAPAPYSRRLVRSTRTVLLGGTDVYSPRCVRHFHDEFKGIVLLNGTPGCGKSALCKSINDIIFSTVMQPADLVTTEMMDMLRMGGTGALAVQRRLRDMRHTHQSRAINFGREWVVCEGSAEADARVYGRMFADSGLMDFDANIRELDEHMLTHRYARCQRIHVWIDTPVDVCMKRTPRCVSAAYMTQLHDMYRTWARDTPGVVRLVGPRVTCAQLLGAIGECVSV